MTDLMAFNSVDYVYVINSIVKLNGAILMFLLVVEICIKILYNNIKDF